MKKKIKLFLVISVMLLMIFSTIVVFCYALGVFDKNDHTTWFEPVRNGGVDDTLVEQIKVGMTFIEIVDILGKPQRDIGSGVWQMEWELKSGDYLVVSFNSKPIEDNESSVSEIYEINLVSYHIEIKSNDLSQ